MKLIRTSLRRLLARIESGFDLFFTPAWNPMYQLGALGWFFYWVVAVSGIYLYIFFDSGVKQAYESVEYLTRTQWYAGGILRSLHRYASDAMVIVMMLHLLREYLQERLYGKRWFAWFTGIPVMWLVFAAGISGYWVVWDRLAQYIAIATTEWFGVLPMFGQSIARNFLHETTLSGRFFTLMVFIHIAVPLFLLFLMWVHIQRHARPRMNPPKGLALGFLLAFVALAIVRPAVSQGPADLNTVVSTIGIDWFYLPLYPLLDHYSPLLLWAALGGGTLILLAAPWIARGRARVPARVNLDSCNGCGWCVADCPYSALTLAPRTDGRPYVQQAVVNTANCVSCGICAGACPTATPFGRHRELKPGIELPDFGIGALRDRSLAAAQALVATDDRVLVYGCREGPDLAALGVAGVGVVEVPCAAMVPPSFIDFLISRRHVDGVFFTGCCESDCYERLGSEWLAARIAGERDPHLRRRVPRERIEHYWAGLDRSGALVRRLAEFRARLHALGPLPGARRHADAAGARSREYA